MSEPLRELISAVAPVASGRPAVARPATQAASSSTTGGVSQSTAEITQLRAVLQSTIESVTANTLALSSVAAVQSQGGAGSTAVDVVKSVASGIASGFGLSSIVSGLLGLFGGGSDNSAPAPLTKFALPQSIQANAGISSGTTVPVDYGQNGLPRAVSTQANQPQVTVQVNAMDSRSFLDRSDDIAQAVRRAMLESSSLNDVVSEI